MVASTQQTLIAALPKNETVTVAADTFPGNGLVGDQACIVRSYRSTKGTFQLANPRGVDNPGPLTWSQLCVSCAAFAVAGTSAQLPSARQPSCRPLRGWR